LPTETTVTTTRDRARTVLVVDDDAKLRDLLKQFFARHGIETLLRPDGSDIEQVLEQHEPDLVVLDIMLPGEDGTAICRRLRGRDYETPIIMLTGRGDEVDRIVGLEMGADDYLGKPFNPRELLARIDAVLRRSDAARRARARKLRFGPFVLDFERRALSRDGEPVPLTNGEFELLAVLAERPGQPLNRDQLLDRTRGREYDAIDRSIDVQISKLRRALEDDPAEPRYIKTVWGYGYVFVAGSEP
jgi:two-component system phosphate regulon response regulator OmpR